jgi:hypothetical protein
MVFFNKANTITLMHIMEFGMIIRKLHFEKKMCKLILLKKNITIDMYSLVCSFIFNPDEPNYDIIYTSNTWINNNGRRLVYKLIRMGYINDINAALDLMITYERLIVNENDYRLYYSFYDKLIPLLNTLDYDLMSHWY